MVATTQKEWNIQGCFPLFNSVGFRLFLDEATKQLLSLLQNRKSKNWINIIETFIRQTVGFQSCNYSGKTELAAREYNL